MIKTKSADAKITAMDDLTDHWLDAQEASVIRSVMKERVTQIINYISRLDTQLNQIINKIIYGDQQLTKSKYMNLNTDMMEIRQMIGPGLDQLYIQLARADLDNHPDTAHTEYCAHLKAILEPYTMVRTKFIVMLHSLGWLTCPDKM